MLFKDVKKNREMTAVLSIKALHYKVQCITKGSKQQLLYRVAVKRTYKSNCTVVSFFCASRSSRSHSYFMCWEVEMLQINYTGSRWPKSKHLASFAWAFPWAVQQICTYSKRTKESFPLRRDGSKEPIHANDDRSYRVIWGLVIKIKCSGKTGALKWYKEGLIFLWEI